MAITGRRGLASDMMMMSMSPPSPTMPSGGGGGGNMPPHGHTGGMKMMHMTFFWGSRVQVLFSDWPGDRGIGIYILSLIIVLAASLILEALSSLSARLSRRPHPNPTTAAILTALHATRMLLAYLVMLAVMSFNVGVLIAAVAGHALGFVVCGTSFFKPSQAGGAANGSEGTPAPAAAAAAHDCSLHSAKY